MNSHHKLEFPTFACNKRWSSLSQYAEDTKFVINVLQPTSINLKHSIACIFFTLFFRILLYSISRHASIYGRYIVPQLSFFVDFYIRVAVRVFTKPSIVKNVCTQHSIVNYCTQCSNFLLTAMAVKSGLNKFVHSVVNSSTKCAQCESC